MREVRAVLQPLWEVWQSSCWSWIFRRTRHKWQPSAPRSKIWDLDRGYSVCPATPPPTVTTELLSPQAVGLGDNSGLSGPGLGTGHSPDPTECPGRDKRESETLGAGGTPECRHLCWAVWLQTASTEMNFRRLQQTSSLW